jgi:hypothetical protein
MQDEVDELSRGLKRLGERVDKLENYFKSWIKNLSERVTELEKGEDQETANP